MATVNPFGMLLVYERNAHALCTKPNDRRIEHTGKQTETFMVFLCYEHELTFFISLVSITVCESLVQLRKCLCLQSGFVAGLSARFGFDRRAKLETLHVARHTHRVI